MSTNSALGLVLHLNLWLALFESVSFLPFEITDSNSDLEAGGQLQQLFPT